MNSNNKIFLSLIIAAVLVTSAVSVYAVSEFITKEDLEQGDVTFAEKEEYLMTLILEEICDVPDTEKARIKSEQYKIMLQDKFLKIIIEERADKTKQILVDKFLVIWPEVISTDKNSNSGIKDKDEKWELIHEFLIKWPNDEGISDALAAEIEKHLTIDTEKIHESVVVDIPPTEESIAESMKEKQESMIEEIKSIDLPPTEESMKRSLEEKKELMLEK